METNTNINHHNRHGHDAVPRNRPAILVARDNSNDRDPTWTWLRLDQSPQGIADDLAQVGIDAEASTDIVVLDQINIGPVMVDEHLDLSRLAGLVAMHGVDQ